MNENSDCVPVTVVIPCFCCARTIVRAIGSVAKQTQKPAEVILVDDASGDETLNFLRTMERQYPGWIKIVALQENSGAASARNAGWAAATQPYIAFLDSDDAWHPKKIEIQYAYMNEHPEVALCGHEYRRLTQQDALPDWDVSECAVQPVHKWALMLSNRFVTPSVMLRRDIEPRFVEKQRYMEDHMLWLKIVCGGGVVVKLSAPLAAIYKRPFGVTGLSAQFWPMERGDLGNYHRLYRASHINGFQLGALIVYSLLKYIRRRVIYWGYLQWKK
ncbi:MAG: glycosyltransferase family 2 protein [Gallionella sp.]|nr:glycosyltransferase family 2 protein [Gallionella sp.]